jgi:hypothetical protein
MTWDRNTSTEDRRAARIAASKARRANWIPTEEITTTVGDIRPGDFIVKIEHYKNIRGVLCNTAASDCLTDWGTWRERGRGGWAVESRRIVTRYGTVNYPVQATAVVRRPKAA